MILAHRGYWKTPEEKNSLEAFERSFTMGWAVEMDIRDYQGRLVISHDIANKSSANLEDLFRRYRTINSNVLLALNIKADGLQVLLKVLIEKYQLTNYFVFDMSVPETLIYLKKGFNIFTRQSDYETNPSFYKEAKGIWVDCFVLDWIDERTIRGHLEQNKRVCLVSPDLHKREHLSFWRKIANMTIAGDSRLMICTDYPEEARSFFHGKD